MKQLIKQKAHELGFVSCRVTSADPISSDGLSKWIDAGRHGDMGYMARNPEKRCDPKNLLPNARSVICCALPYGENGLVFDCEGSCGISNRKNVARFSRGSDYHIVVKEKLGELVRVILNQNPNAKTKCCVDTSPILEKALAARAGVGWVGKNTLLVNRDFGSWFVLGEIITDVEIEPDEPVENKCGSCTKCMDACPTKALEEKSLDARKCISYLTIECRAENDIDSYGCDLCQEACPYNSN